MDVVQAFRGFDGAVALTGDREDRSS